MLLSWRVIPWQKKRHNKNVLFLRLFKCRFMLKKSPSYSPLLSVSPSWHYNHTASAVQLPVKNFPAEWSLRRIQEELGKVNRTGNGDEIISPFQHSLPRWQCIENTIAEGSLTVNSHQIYAAVESTIQISSLKKLIETWRHEQLNKSSRCWCGNWKCSKWVSKKVFLFERATP